VASQPAGVTNTHKSTAQGFAETQLSVNRMIARLTIDTVESLVFYWPQHASRGLPTVIEPVHPLTGFLFDSDLIVKETDGMNQLRLV
jgi:hypothetical protein